MEVVEATVEIITITTISTNRIAREYVYQKSIVMMMILVTLSGNSLLAF